jgi:HK97 family phage major capsid protein
MGQIRYPRHDVRSNQAAPVAPGGRKPVSDYALTPVEDSCKTIAHLSTPVQRQSLADAVTLQDFIQTEMFYGVERALEDEVINGDGTGQNLTGLAHTSGVQTVAYSTDLVTTTRKAVTALENQGLTGTSFWVMAPADFEAIELNLTDMGTYVMTEAGQAVPVESATRRLWSRSVVVSVSAPAGTAYLVDAGSVRLYVREDANLSWSENVYDPDALGTGVGASDFERNLVRFRAEGGFGFGVLRPSGVVKVSLA